MFFVVFVFSAIATATLNVGNITGIILSAIIFLYAAAFNPINYAVKWLWNIACGRVFVCVVGFVVLAILVTAGWITFKMAGAVVKRPNDDSTVIVLGCQVHSYGPSLMLQNRLDAAYVYLADNPQVKCIVSGGQGADEPVSEAKCMYDYLTARGIAPDRLYIEGRSTTTAENLAFSEEIIEANNLNPKIAIATNEFHMYRACRLAEEMGFECSAISARTPLPLLPTFYIRELYAVLVQFIFE